MQEKIPTDLLMEPVEVEDENMTTDAEVKAGEQRNDSIANSSDILGIEVVRLQALLKYYQDGAAFAKLINSSCASVADLLGSSLKLEVSSAMKFFVTAHRFDLEDAEVIYYLFRSVLKRWFIRFGIKIQAKRNPAVLDLP